MRRTIVIAHLSWIAAIASCRAESPAVGEKSDAPGLRSIRQTIEKLRPLHEKKSPAAPGEWLAEHRETGQSFAQYVRRGAIRVTEKRSKIYVQPLGEFTPAQERIVDATVEYLQRFYQTPVEKLKPIPLDAIPPTAKRTHPTWGDEQILTTFVLESLLPERLPGDAVATIALTASDLWPGEGWNFVFGQASLSKRVGVWSIYRSGDPAAGDAEEKLCLIRTIKTASHELGHMFGMKHCIAYECAMNGSNHQAESDTRPLAFCPECSAKAWWAARAEPGKQLRELAEFANQHGLTAEAQFWRRSIDALR